MALSAPEESLLYTNREKIQGEFLGLLRLFQQNQHSVFGIENGAATIGRLPKLA
ncbi:hypothetical protein PF010_g28003 [Phytophthora fragariae]|uniref:Uncharacterized protein n=1 Tax=Phytophthora fragariae TaxID=53985 RepID=A0A6G0MLK3_9STRA|nr:hypothetical protein PF010_g28003 [Phytophthora fragariae]KAE9172175.1 hypothetical protein PF004_g27344 [Phytophthora fragariae]